MGTDPADTPDEVLCLRYRGGDRLAGEQLAERYLKTVRSITRPYYLAGADSEDLLQEGMLGLLAAMREFEAERSNGIPFAGFASVCIRRRIFSAIRKSQGKNQDVLNTAVSIEQTASGEEFLFAEETEDPETLLIRDEERQRFASRVQQILSDFEQRVLQLYLQGYSYAEMAQHLKRTYKSVDSAIGRIRTKIRHEVLQEPPESPQPKG